MPHSVPISQPHGAGRTLALHVPEAPTPLERIAPLIPIWAEREAQIEANGGIRLAPETLQEFRHCGILASPLPITLGGQEASLRQVTEAIRHLARTAPSTALALAMPLGNAATTRIPHEWIPLPMRAAFQEGQQWIADQIHAGALLAVANSEPGAGGELANTATQALPDDAGGWRLTGRKSFATLGPDADFFLCAARRPDGVIDGYWVARTAPGLEVDDQWNPLGMRATASVGLTLTAAPASSVFGYPGCLSGINARHWSTLLFASVFVGIGEGAIAAGHAASPPDSPWVQATLAEATLNLDAAAGFLIGTALEETYDPALGYGERCRRVKTFAARTGLEAAMRAAMVAGGRAYRPDHPIARLLQAAVAGPLLRPTFPQAMDAIARSL